MEPRKDEKIAQLRIEPKPSRFRINKLEERIAPRAPRPHVPGFPGTPVGEVTIPESHGI